ncbi:hypothetical protein [Streptomyces millisiae]|uniref:Uncharacterized protein n=1 Tax=Streptomyces millisiae TaxID=3075542 RepID=A0ABU2LWS9_9ACTN|nr:hypothetical protein [Streptomyces sp. DSM 44918]MDT0321642.1 hypothetical protein [Streptomyces sp. DSM 44918]
MAATVISGLVEEDVIRLCGAVRSPGVLRMTGLGALLLDGEGPQLVVPGDVCGAHRLGLRR